MTTNVVEQKTVPSTAGNVLHGAFRYDLLIWLVSLGREQAYREKTLNLAGLKSGELGLDVGCGTGTLAIAPKRRVGPAGRGYVNDPSPEQIARASKKAKDAVLEGAFENHGPHKNP